MIERFGLPWGRAGVAATPDAIDADDGSDADQLRAALAQVRRSLGPVAVAHALVAAVLWREGHGLGGALWWVAVTAVNSLRSVCVQRIGLDSPDNRARTRHAMASWLFALGAVETVPLILSGLAANREAHYLVTMIMLGLTVGGVSNLAGLLSHYVLWASPLFAVLCGLWLRQGGVEGVGVALLLLLLFALLGSYVRDYGALLERERSLSRSLRRERDRAAAAVEDKTRFFAAASHDLRQPLGALRWYGEAVATHAHELGHEALQEIGAGIARALERTEPMLAQYLEIARLESASEAAARAPVSIGDLFERLHGEWAAEAERRGLELPIESSDGGLAAQASSHAGSLKRILDNLIGNAIKFTPAGKVTLSASRPLAAPGFVRLSVTDTGIGIAPMHGQRLFDDFYQAANPERSGDRGVGLGLAIARRYADKLGARLGYASTPGLGSTFHLDLPLADDVPQATSGQRTAPRSPPPAVQRPGPHLHVLIVDDDAEVRTALRAALQARAWTVTAVSGGNDGLAAWHGGAAPDVLLVDFRLAEGRTGLDAIAALRAAGCTAPALVITGDIAPASMQAIARSGHGLLHKPVAHAELETALLALVATPHANE